MIIAGERSGVGKTTVTLALLAGLSRRNLQVQSFKVGPDYIDPMFHYYVTGRPCRNLDPVLTSERYVQQCFQKHSQAVSHCLVEGVMGLFDGAVDRQDFGSTAHVARLLNLPILLVLDCSRLSYSIAALLHGYRSFDPRLQIAGVVLNRVGSDRHLEMLRAAIAPSDVPILGVLRRNQGIALPDRHLGLIPTDELKDLDRVIEQLAQVGESCFDWGRLMPLLQGRGAGGQGGRGDPERARCRVAIARDGAFSFYYADNLDLLRELGAELVAWSPLSDRGLPEGVQGLYFGGGFPEMFAAQLAENQEALAAVQRAIGAGMPTYAECGGLMYLGESLTDLEGQVFPMVGALPTRTVMGARLVLGYRRAIALQDSPLLRQFQTVTGHEFHRSHLTAPAPNPVYQFPAPLEAEGHQTPTLQASYLHLHWGANPEIPARFVQQCAQFPAGDEGSIGTGKG